MSNDYLITSTINRVALVVALIVAISLPLGYGVIAFHTLSTELQFKAKVKAAALNKLITNNPELWIYAENQMQGRLTREPVPLETELVQVYDVGSVLIIQVGQTPAPPRLGRSYPLYDTVRVVGRIEVSDSLRGLIYGTAVASAFGVLLGTVVFVLMLVIPLRRLRQALKALADSESRFHTLVDLLPYGVLECDLNGRITFANPALEHLCGYADRGLVGRFIWDFLADDAGHKFLRDYLPILIPFSDRSYHFQAPNGSTRHSRECGNPGSR